MGRECNRLRSVAGLRNNHEIVLGVEYHAEAHAEQRLIIDQHDPDLTHFWSSSSKVIVARNRQPPFGNDEAVSVPP